MQYKCFASCAFGLEGITAQELKNLKAEDVLARDARVYFSADTHEIARANLWLRTADRVYIELGQAEAPTFDALFEAVKATPWEDYIPADARIDVNADAVGSALFSVSDIQSISKKAIAVRLGQKYHLNTLPETGARYDVHIKLLRNTASLCLNVSGQGLNRRGYRKENVAAPIRETLAAGIVMLSNWRGGDFADPLCGSGTIAIEAAMIGANIAPGLTRTFDGEHWRMFGSEWKAERQVAQEAMKPHPDVYASDIDPKAIRAADANAKAAGVALKLYHADVNDFARKDCLVVTNPPYAQRLGDTESVHKLYQDMGKAFADVQRKHIITADEQFERYFGKRAAKKRKLYNGSIRCTLYSYF
jgi:putative N6-adenine-specific DNA methylase